MRPFSDESACCATSACASTPTRRPSSSPKLVLLAALGLLDSGWYTIPKAGLYGALPGQSGAAIAVGGIGGFAAAAVPIAIGLAADAVGLGLTMWALLGAPVVLLLLTPRR